MFISFYTILFLWSINYMDCIQDSIATSLTLQLFSDLHEASFAHIFQSKMVKLPISMFENVDNFDSVRMQKSAVDAYPLTNRPRGRKDVNSVKFYQRQIRKNRKIPPIWILKKNETYILLDGAHRIVSSYIEGKKYIYSNLIQM